MIRKSVPTLRMNLVFAVAALCLLSISACVSYDLTGLDAISPDGRWATIVQGKNQELFLLDLESAESTPIRLAERSESLIKSSFSYDGRYVLFNDSVNWLLYNINTREKQVVAEIDAAAELLPSDEILLTSSENNLGRFSVLRNLDNVQSTEVLVENIQYRFSNRTLITRMPGPGFISVHSCPQITPIVPAVWVLVSVNNDVYVLIADSGSPLSIDKTSSDSATQLVEFVEPIEVWYLSLGGEGSLLLSQTFPDQATSIASSGTDETAKLPQELASVFVELVGTQEQEPVLATLQRYPNNEITITRQTSGGAAITFLPPEFVQDLNAWIDDQESNTEDFVTQILSDEYNSIFGGIQQYGLPSPDGTELLFLQSKISEDNEAEYFLDLIDLSITAQENVSLVAGSNWVPSFNFSPNGKRIMFESNLSFDFPEHTGRSMFVANIDGNDIERVETSGEIIRACWH